MNMMRSISVQNYYIVFLVQVLFFTICTYADEQKYVIYDITHIHDEASDKVIIFLSHKTDYDINTIPADKNNPYKVYLDFKYTLLSKEVPRTIDIDSDNVLRVRSGQFNRNTARVVLDFYDIYKPQIAAYNDPPRVVLYLGENKLAGHLSDKHSIGDHEKGHQNDQNIVALSNENKNMDIVEGETSNEEKEEEPFDPDARPPLPIKIGDKISLGSKINLSLDTRDNSEDLDDDSGDTLSRFESQLSVAGLINPYPSIDIYGEGRFSHLEILEDELNIDDDKSDAVLRRAYLHWRDFLVPHFDFQVGRQRIKDDREWIFDDNLDAFRIFYKPVRFSFDFSVSSILIDIEDNRDKTVNYIMYSGYEYDKDERLSIFSVIRQDRDGTDDTYTFGASWRGRPLNRRNKVWIDNAVYIGKNRERKWAKGYGIDAGFSKTFKKRFRPNFTIASAFGSKNFRQTRLEDNNGRFKGVTNFKYYGEVFDPELSNLSIGTLGLGVRPKKKSSVDLVYHYFYQVDKRDRLVSPDIEPDPTGDRREIGHEIDFIFGTNITKWVKFSLSSGVLFPGSAFRDDDLAYFSEIELQFSLR